MLGNLATCKKRISEVNEPDGIGIGKMITGLPTWENDILDSTININAFKEMLIASTAAGAGRTVRLRKLTEKLEVDRDAHNIAYNHAGWVGPELGMTADDFRSWLDTLNRRDRVGGNVPYQTSVVVSNDARARGGGPRSGGLFIETHKPVTDDQVDNAFKRSLGAGEMPFDAVGGGASRVKFKIGGRYVYRGGYYAERARDEGMQRLARGGGAGADWIAAQAAQGNAAAAAAKAAAELDAAIVTANRQVYNDREAKDWRSMAQDLGDFHFPDIL